MYFRPARTLFGLIAVGGAIAVGLITRDAEFTALTFFGGLLLPRVLGFRGRRPFGWSGGPAHRQELRNYIHQGRRAWAGEAQRDRAADVTTSGSAGA